MMDRKKYIMGRLRQINRWSSEYIRLAAALYREYGLRYDKFNVLYTPTAQGRRNAWNKAAHTVRLPV